MADINHISSGSLGVDGLLHINGHPLHLYCQWTNGNYVDDTSTDESNKEIA